MLNYPLISGNWDAIALTEMRGKHTAREANNFIVSAPAPVHGKASGCAIRLSKRAMKHVISSGNQGSRIVWVKLKGATANLWIFGVYLPHGARTNPSH